MRLFYLEYLRAYRRGWKVPIGRPYYSDIPLSPIAVWVQNACGARAHLGSGLFLGVN